MTVLISVAVMGLVMTVMAVGVILGRSPLKGSCGGKGGPECVCDAYEQEKCKARERMFQLKAEANK